MVNSLTKKLLSENLNLLENMDLTWKAVAKQGLVVHSCKTRAWEIEVGGSWISGQSAWHGKALS